jgi:hypothetical protein
MIAAVVGSSGCGGQGPRSLRALCVRELALLRKSH